MGPEDFRLKKHVEAILVRNYVNTQRVEVDVISGNVYLDGFFETLDDDVGGAGESKEVIEERHNERRALLAIEQQIRSNGEVQGLFFDFTNWTRAGTGWMRK